MGCWMLLGLLQIAPSSFQCHYESLELNKIQKNSEQLPPCLDWSIEYQSWKQYEKTLHVCRQSDLRHLESALYFTFCWQKQHLNSLDIFVCTRSKMKARHSKDHNTHMIAGCLWNLVHFCERSRRNGGRWWPQVRERWCGCIRNLPHAGDCVKSVEQISGRGIALKVIFDLTEDSLGCFSRIVAGWWDPKGLSPYDQGTPLQVRDLDRIVENRRVERCREMLTTLAMLIILLKYSRSTWSHRFFTNGKHNSSV